MYTNDARPEALNGHNVSRAIHLAPASPIFLAFFLRRSFTPSPFRSFTKPLICRLLRIVPFTRSKTDYPIIPSFFGLPVRPFLAQTGGMLIYKLLALVF